MKIYFSILLQNSSDSSFLSSERNKASSSKGTPPSVLVNKDTSGKSPTPHKFSLCVRSPSFALFAHSAHSALSVRRATMASFPFLSSQIPSQRERSYRPFSLARACASASSRACFRLFGCPTIVRAVASIACVQRRHSALPSLLCWGARMYISLNLHSADARLPRRLLHATLPSWAFLFRWVADV